MSSSLGSMHSLVRAYQEASGDHRPTPVHIEEFTSVPAFRKAGAGLVVSPDVASDIHNLVTNRQSPHRQPSRERLSVQHALTALAGPSDSTIDAWQQVNSGQSVSNGLVDTVMSRLSGRSTAATYTSAAHRAMDGVAPPNATRHMSPWEEAGLPPENTTRHMSPWEEAGLPPTSRRNYGRGDAGSVRDF